MITKRLLSIISAAAIAHAVTAAPDSTSAPYKKFLPEVHATLRARYELATESGDGRFQVRNARVNLNGSLTDFLGYYLRADFCDRGSFKMLDAYAIFKPDAHWRVMMGQMRVPLSVDASRSVHNYWFANRSLPARDMWGSRKVGLKARYSFSPAGASAFVEGGIFSSASTSAQTSWSKNYTYAVIGAVEAGDWTPEIGFQSNELGSTRVNLWNMSLTWERDGLWEAEGEVLWKCYSNNAARTVFAYNLMARRFFPLNCRFANRLSADLRFDSSTDNCDGARNEHGDLIVTQTARKRLTVGATLAWLKGPVNTHLRLNYEQYFHKAGHISSPSDGANRLCLELMLHF
ncbi:MAG: OprO/OprP family phosphate-selective porin [Muribaculaceae bacterium]|nr:OprO/OprP family phosphate-selective porin [Muribaculaceae bacterium]